MLRAPWILFSSAALFVAGCVTPQTEAPKLVAPSVAQPPVREAVARPAFKAEKLVAIDTAVATAIAAKKLPGGVLWLDRDGVTYRKVYGDRALSPAQQPTTE